MRTQLTAILAMGIMAFVAFGLMAGYLTKQDPQARLRAKIEAGVPVRTVSIEERAGGRELYLHLAPRKGVVSTRKLGWRAIRFAQPELERQRAGRPAFAVWTVEIDGAGVLRVSERMLRRHRILAQLTEAAADGIAAATGPGAEISVVERREQLGVRVRARLGRRDPKKLGRQVMRLTGNQPDFVWVVAADTAPETTTEVPRR